MAKEIHQLLQDIQQNSEISINVSDISPNLPIVTAGTLTSVAKLPLAPGERLHRCSLYHSMLDNSLIALTMTFSLNKNERIRLLTFNLQTAQWTLNHEVASHYGSGDHFNIRSSSPIVNIHRNSTLILQEQALRAGLIILLSDDNYIELGCYNKTMKSWHCGSVGKFPVKNGSKFKGVTFDNKVVFEEPINIARLAEEEARLETQLQQVRDDQESQEELGYDYDDGRKEEIAQLKQQLKDMNKLEQERYIIWDIWKNWTTYDPKTMGAIQPCSLLSDQDVVPFVQYSSNSIAISNPITQKPEQVFFNAIDSAKKMVALTRLHHNSPYDTDTSQAASINEDGEIFIWSNIKKTPTNITYFDFEPVLDALIQKARSKPNFTITLLDLRGLILPSTAYTKLKALIESPATIKELYIENGILSEVHKNSLLHILTNKTPNISPDTQPSTLCLSSYTPPPRTVYNKVAVPDDFCCSITSQIMFDPVSDALGQTYEREAIENYFTTSTQSSASTTTKSATDLDKEKTEDMVLKCKRETSSASLELRSPLTNEVLEDSQLRPNVVLRKIIGSFLEQNPTAWHEVYFPQTLAAEIAETCRTPTATTSLLQQLLQKNPRIMVLPIANDQTILEYLCHQDDNRFEQLFPFVMHLLKQEDCVELMHLKPLVDWLSLVCSKGNTAMTTLFIEHISKHLQITITPQTLIEQALKDDNPVFLRFALSQSPQLLHEDMGRGNTVLHLAAAQGKLEIVKFLVKQEGINLKQRNFDNQKPIELAQASGQQHVVHVLEQHKLATGLQKMGVFALSENLARLQQTVAQQQQQIAALQEQLAATNKPSS